MSRFLKLTNMIINTNDIHKILIYPNKYDIYIVSKKIDGFSWSCNIFGFGNISTHESQIQVCETKHSTDYKIVSEWISKI